MLELKKSPRNAVFSGIFVHSVFFKSYIMNFRSFEAKVFFDFFLINLTSFFNESDSEEKNTARKPVTRIIVKQISFCFTNVPQSS